MIVVDTSAIVAIFRQEPDAASFALRIAQDDQPMISAASVVETSMVLRGLKRISADEAERWLDDFLARGDFTVAVVSAEQTKIARRAHRRFGKGGGHPAQLNFGDCFVYALATELGAPLLFKGDDFARTDIAPALQGP